MNVHILDMNVYCDHGLYTIQNLAQNSLVYLLIESIEIMKMAKFDNQDFMG